MPPRSLPLPAPDWVALAAHALAHRWPNIPPVQLEDVAADLYRDETLRALSPAKAVARWLQPLLVAPGDRDAPSDRFAAQGLQMPQRNPRPTRPSDKSCRLPSGRFVRLGRREVADHPWGAHCMGRYFVVTRKGDGWGTETYRQPFDVQSLVLDTAEDAEALAGALNAHARRIAKAKTTHGTT